MSFCVNEFEVGVHDTIFSGNEQQKMFWSASLNGPKQLHLVDFLSLCLCLDENKDRHVILCIFLRRYSIWNAY